MKKNNNPLHKRQKQDTKGKSYRTQLVTIFQYLQQHTATNTMVSTVTGVPQKNICRFKRDLEKVGRLWEVEKKPCRLTGHKAWYLTTNPDKAPFNNQLTLF